MFHLQETMRVEILPSVFLSLAAAGLLCLSWKVVNYSDDDGPRVLPMEYQTIKRYGKNSFFWFGIYPRITIMEPELIREILNKHEIYHKIKLNTKLLVTGLVFCEGEKWSKHRRILSPAFHIEKLKYTLPSMQLSCESMVRKWEGMLSNEESVELDVWPFIDHMSGETISRAAFGRSYEEGVEVFGLQKEQIMHAFDQYRSKLNQIPGWRYLPTKRLRRMKVIHMTIRALILNLIEQRKSKAAEVSNKERDDDLLELLLESNAKEAEGSTGHGISKGLSVEEIIEEVKLFYLAGQDTTASSLVWAMIMLSQHQDWQQRARDEVFKLFGTATPHFDGLSRLKIVTMIINEVLRLYPVVASLVRSIDEPTKLKDITLLPGMTLNLPVIFVHRDPEIWGEDAHEFNPERFSGGSSRIPGSFFPFGGGSRLCIGKPFAMLELKMALAMILQRFSFRLSPSYSHAPRVSVSLEPQSGAHLILRKLQS
ncbi:Cytochrome P450 72A397-like protein [Drosera capensis]